MDRGTWWAKGHGVAESWTPLSDILSLSPEFFEETEERGTKLCHILTNQNVFFPMYVQISSQKDIMGFIVKCFIQKQTKY